MMRGWTVPLVGGSLLAAVLWVGCGQDGTTPRCSEAPLYSHRYDIDGGQGQDFRDFECFIDGKPAAGSECDPNSDAAALSNNERYNNIREHVVPNEGQPDFGTLTDPDEDCLTAPENPDEPSGGTSSTGTGGTAGTN